MMQFMMRYFTLFMLLLLAALPARAQTTNPLQHAWEVDPDFGDIWSLKPLERAIMIDVGDLQSDVVDQRMQAARMICREHNNSKFEKYRERAKELLLARLKIGEPNAQVFRSMLAAALLVCEPSSAPMLWELGQNDPVTRPIVEKTLAKWKSDVALAVWRQRLDSPRAHVTDIGLALAGLTAVGKSEDRSRLERILLGNKTTDGNRLLAAQALGATQTNGMNDLAQKILESDLPNHFLLAVNLSSNHSDAKSIEQWGKILQEGPSVAQRVAYRAMMSHAREVAEKNAPFAVTNKDSVMRMLGLEVLHSMADNASIRLQGELLNDPHRDVRSLAMQQLIQKATNQRKVVDEIVSMHLHSSDWTGIEKGIVIATKLNDHSRLSRFVELLNHQRPEVYMHAAWGLMEIANEPALMEPIFKHTQELTEFLENRIRPLEDTVHLRLSFLLECLAKNEYQPCHDMLLKYVPKDFKMGILGRVSAIWALGKLNKGKENPDLSAALQDRVQDVASPVPEEHLVRFASVLALGEMGSGDSRATLEQFNEPLPFPMGYACNWALKRIEEAGH
jgi:hypothetical protein